jgi:hypothetical protein
MFDHIRFQGIFRFAIGVIMLAIGAVLDILSHLQALDYLQNHWDAGFRILNSSKTHTALILLGLLMIWSAYRNSKRKPASIDRPVVPFQNTNDEFSTPYKSEPHENLRRLPPERPKIYPTRYGERSSDRRSGLFIRNDGETAFSVTAHQVKIGTSNMEFWSDIPVLTKDSGEVLMENNIQLDSGTGTFGTALMREMIKFGLLSIPLKITYKDGENRWYLTECELERDVLTPGGIAVKFIAQSLTTEPKPEISPDKAEIWPVPDVALVWDWTEDQKKLRGLSGTEKTILVQNRSPQEWIYNVQIHPIELGQKLEFERINEIAPGKVHETLGRWANSSSLTTDIAEFFIEPINEQEAQRKGWKYKKTHNRGMSPYFLRIPMRVTYTSKNKEWEHRTTFVFDIGRESHFERD